MVKYICFLVTFLSFGVSVFNAQTQKISFETAEGYTVGNLGGQNGWTVWGGLPLVNAQIVALNATDGANLFNMISAGEVQDFCGIEKDISSFVTSSDVEISFDYNFAGINSSDYEIAVYNDGVNYDYTAAFRIDYLTGKLVYRDANGFVDGPVLAPNQWHNLKIIIRQSNNTLQYFANGTQVYSGALGTSKNAEIIDFVYDDYGTGFSVDNIRINNLVALSTNEVSEKQSVKIYPNPATERINIEVDDKIQSITIFDVKGRLVKNIQESGISNGKIIDVSDLSTGMYIVKVKTTTSKFINKIIKK